MISLTLEDRQPRTDMEITSVDYGDAEAVITAEGNMGEFMLVIISAITRSALAALTPHKEGDS